MTAYLVDKVFAGRLGQSATGTLMIADIPCQRDRSSAPVVDAGRWRDEDRLCFWWIDGEGLHRGDLSE